MSVIIFYDMAGVGPGQMNIPSFAVVIPIPNEIPFVSQFVDLRHLPVKNVLHEANDDLFSFP